MVKHVARCLLLSGLMTAAGCGSDGSEAPPSVTIDVRCDSSADCPSGFACSTDVEHGPPITLCESPDPAASCPSGFETKVMYGLTVCKPPVSPVSVVRAPRAGHPSERHRRPAR